MLTREQPETRRYMPGNGPWRVGDRVKFLGAPSDLYPGYDRGRMYLKPDGQMWPVIFHRGQRKVEVDETAIVVKDNGFDYRYILRMDNDGLVVRPGPGRWELIELDAEEVSNELS